MLFTVVTQHRRRLVLNHYSANHYRVRVNWWHSVYRLCSAYCMVETLHTIWSYTNNLWSQPCVTRIMTYVSQC